MANLTDREKLIASTFSIVDVWVSHLEENGMDASEAIALREKSLSEGKTEEEFMAWCESNKLSQEEPVPMGYSTMEEYNAKQYQRDRQYPAFFVYPVFIPSTLRSLNNNAFLFRCFILLNWKSRKLNRLYISGNLSINCLLYTSPSPRDRG